MYLRDGDTSGWRGSNGGGTGVPAAVVPPSLAIPPQSPAAAGEASKRTGSRYRTGRWSTLPSIVLHGVRIHAVTESQAIGFILTELAGGRGGVVVTPNLDHLRRCGNDVSFGAIVSEADLVVADGMPLIWASRLQGTPLPQRVAGSDLISSLSGAAAQADRSVFLLGGTSGTADAAAEVLKGKFPQLRVAGTYCPPLGFEGDEQELAKIRQALSASRPDIVYVALGSPKQERLIERIRRTLPESWWLGVGVSFSFLCGDVRRAPLWMRKTGLEWVHRLLQEPKRLFKRYILTGLPFAAALLGRATLRGIPPRMRRLRADAAPVGGETVAPPPPTCDEVLSALAQVAPRPVTAETAAVESPAAVFAAAGEPVAASADAGAAGSTAGMPARGEGVIGEGVTIVSDAAIEPEAVGLQKLKGLLLLGGSVRPTPLAAAIGRSVLDLPIDAERSVLIHWLEQAAGVAQRAEIDRLPVRVLVDRGSPEPTTAAGAYTGRYTIERDLSEYRGTGGLLAAIGSEYDDDDLILVGNAAQILLEPLADLAMVLRRTGAVVSLVSHHDGTPSGLMLVRCGALRLIPKVGFVDMKEQALPAIAAKHDVRVVHRRRPTGMPVRSLSDYILALRNYHRRGSDPTPVIDPLAEEWRPSFTLAERGASVDPMARVHDSVVLTGGTVEAGAVLVRSVVTPGGVLRRDRKAADQLVTTQTKA